MFTKILLINPTATYDLSVGSLEIRHIYLDGGGLPPVERRLSTGPDIQGARDEGFRLQPRQMTLALAVNTSNVPTDAGHDFNRDTLYRIFAPNDTPLKLRVYRSDGKLLQIDCHVNGTLDTPESQEAGTNRLTVRVPLIAPNPIWYDPIERSATATGATTQNVLVAYSGNWREWPRIRVNAPYGNFYVVSFDAAGVENNRFTYLAPNATAGQWVQFDLLNRTVKDHVGVNKIANMNFSTLEGFFNMRLRANDVQTIRVNKEGTTTSLTSSTVYWYDRYLGV